MRAENSVSGMLKDWVNELIESDNIVIVEGQKDKAALVALGIPTDRITALNGRPLFVVAESIAKSVSKQKSGQCVILVDFDAEGRKLYSRLSKDLTKLRVRIDNAPREFIFKNTKIRQIENLINYC